LSSLGIRFLATSQGLDTDESNPASKLLLHILAAVAQFERELIHERVSAGMTAAQKHGAKTGNAIGRPRRIVNRDEVIRLRETGLSIEGSRNRWHWRRHGGVGPTGWGSGLTHRSEDRLCMVGPEAQTRSTWLASR